MKLLNSRLGAPRVRFAHLGLVCTRLLADSNGRTHFFLGADGVPKIDLFGAGLAPLRASSVCLRRVMALHCVVKGGLGNLYGSLASLGQFQSVSVWTHSDRQGPALGQDGIQVHLGMGPDGEKEQSIRRHIYIYIYM